LLVVPLETFGKRIDHNAELSLSLLSYSEERTRQLQKMLKEIKKRSTAVPYHRQSVISSGSLENVIDAFNKLQDNEAIQLHGRASALEIRLRQVLALARDNAVGEFGCCV
jgi:hypothetical protein